MYQLTARELQVLKLLAKGLTNKAIAERIGCGKKTVDSHVCHIFKECGCKNRIELLMLYIKDESQFVLRQIPRLRDSIIELSKQGMDRKQIAERLKASHLYVCRVISHAQSFE